MTVDRDPPAAPSPGIVDPRQSARQWLDAVGRSGESFVTDLTAWLQALNAQKVYVGTRYEVLEMLRPAVFHTLQAQQRAYTIGAVPMSRYYEAEWRRALDLLQAFDAGYDHCLVVFGESPEQLAEFGARFCCRRLDNVARILLEHFRVFREAPSQAWVDLHSLYALAESYELLDVVVDDPARPDSGVRSCRAAYVRAILIHLAGPGSFLPHEFVVLETLVEQVASMVHVARDILDAEAGASVTVDLNSDQGARLEVGESERPSLRHLELAGVARQLKTTLAMLRRGEPYDALPLRPPPSTTRADFEALLKRLHLQWRGGMRGRAHRRAQANNTAQVCVGIRAVHYFLGLRRLEANLEIEPRDDHFASTSTAVYARTEPVFVMDEWQVVDRSPGGVGLTRAVDASGRVILGGLVGLLSPLDEGLMLGKVAWVKQNASQSLRFGVRLIPGVATAVAVRTQATDDEFQPALLLDAVPAMNEPESIVLPNGWFKPGLTVEVFVPGSPHWSAVTLELQSSGADFERITFRRL